MFPASLVQLTTIGPQHNFTPIRQVIVGYGELIGEEKNFEMEIIRIYFDGLVARIHMDSNFSFAENNPVFLKCVGETGITGIPYEASWQHENMLRSIVETGTH